MVSCCPAGSHKLFHELWSKTVRTVHYDKSKWMELDWELSQAIANSDRTEERHIIAEAEKLHMLQSGKYPFLVE